MTSKATRPLRLPGLFQGNDHSLAGHLSPSFQDETGTVLILKKEKKAWRGLHVGLAHLTPLRVLLFQDNKDPPPQIWAPGDNQGPPPPHATKILQSRNQLILEIQTTEPSFNLHEFSVLLLGCYVQQQWCRHLLLTDTHHVLDSPELSPA